MSFIKENWVWILSPMVLIFAIVAWLVIPPPGEPAKLSGTKTSAISIPVGETWTMTIAVNQGTRQLVSVLGKNEPVSMKEVAAAINALNGVSARVVNGAVEITTDEAGYDSSLQVRSGAVEMDLSSACGISKEITYARSGEVAPHQYLLFD